MDEILDDLTDSSLATAVKSNLYTFFRSLRHSPLAEFSSLPGLVRWRTQLPHPWFNAVLSNSAAERDELDIIQETIAYFQSHGISTFTWWLETGSEQETWSKVFPSHGFHYDDHTPGMAMDLAVLPASFVQPEGLVIQPVEDFHMLQTWADTFITGYGLPPDFVTPFFDLLASLGVDLPNRHYLGFLNRVPVTASTLFLGAGVAGIYNVATLPEARGKGLGAAMTLFPLHQARQMGYQAGILQSSEMGFNLYRRLGFRQVCVMEHYYRNTVFQENL
jgi:ribosomal protein S18 acetylase RimI-like enzyme